MRALSRRTFLYAFQTLLGRIASTSLKVKTWRNPHLSEFADHLDDARADPLSTGAQSNPKMVCANIFIETILCAGVIIGFARYSPSELKELYNM